MNWIDIMVAVLVFGLGFMGWRNGLIRWVVMFLGGLIGLVLAIWFYASLAPLFSPIADSEGIQKTLGFGAIFFAILLTSWVISRLIKTALNIVMMGWVDNLAGLGFGMLVGSFVAYLIISLMGILPLESVKESIVESSTVDPLKKTFGLIRTFLPAELDTLTDLVRPLTENNP